MMVIWFCITEPVFDGMPKLQTRGKAIFQDDGNLVFILLEMVWLSVPIPMVEERKINCSG
jgi:hypothetical protein